VGTRASGEGEPYTQEANATDAAMVRLKCRTRDTLITWTSLRRWLRGRGTKREGISNYSPAPQPDIGLRESGSLTGLTSYEASSKPGTPGEGVKRAPTAAQNLRHEQRRNLWLVPEGVGWLMANTSRGAERS
jgi:hypothetical protein